MYQMTASYAPPSDPAAFLHHYRTVHTPLARALPDVDSFTWTICRSVDGSPPAHFLIAALRWADEQHAMAALGSPAGAAAVADLANFAGAGVAIELGECVVEI